MRRRVQIGPRGVLLLACGAFVALATAALLGEAPGDAWVRETLLAHSPPALVALLRWINHAGSWRVLGPATVALVLAFPRARRTWWIWVALMLGAALLEGGLKEVIARRRPEGLALGFPSGHATAAAAYFGALIYVAADLPPAACRAVRAGAAALIVLVALARVLLRAHWPSDALGGIALGLACAAAAALISESIARSRPGPRSPAVSARG